MADQDRPEGEDHDQENDEENEKDQNSRRQPTEAMALQLAGNRVERVGDRHAGNEREKNAPEDQQEPHKHDQRRQPERRGAGASAHSPGPPGAPTIPCAPAICRTQPTI